MTVSAIVLSGHTMGLGVSRALGKMGVPVVMFHYPERDLARVSRYVVESIESPNPEHDEDGFVQKLVEYGTRRGGGLLMPTSDETVVAVARNKALLKQHFTVACPDWAVTQQFIDKKHTYALADAIGVPAPKTFVPNSLEEVEERAHLLGFPCLVKPSTGHLFYTRFKRKMFPVDNLDELVEVYRQAAQAGLQVMLQEIIPGDDSHGVNYNAYVWDGRALAEFTARKVRNAPPWYGSPRVAISEEISEVIEPGRRILQALQFAGFACTEFKKDARDGVYKLMEVNGRHNLSTLLAVTCGINFPWLEYRHHICGEVPSPRDFRKGVYWIDITRDVGYSLKYARKERYSIADYLRPYLKPHVFAILDFRDPKPFIRRIMLLLGQGLRQGLNRLHLRRVNLRGVRLLRSTQDLKKR